MTEARTDDLETVEAVPDWRQSLVFAEAADAGILPSLPGTATEVAQRAGTDENATRVALDALEVWGFVSSGGDHGYERGPSWPSPDEQAALFQQARFIRGTATQLPDRLRGVIGPMPDRSDNEVDRWQAAMAARARKAAPSVVDACLAEVPHARRILDLGGGHGEYALEFARRGVTAVLQDRPATLAYPHRRELWEAGGVELFPGDFFEVLPEGPFDIVFCSGVTHTMSAERNQTLYGRVRPLVAEGGALAVVTLLRGSARARLFAVQMLVVGNRGDTHSEHEYRQWLADAGFGMERRTVEGPNQALLIARPT